jgi:exo-1,4-beta-D-glucosaminidase
MRALQAVSALVAALSSVEATSSVLVQSPGDTTALPGWHLQSTPRVSKDLAALSKPGADVSKWYRVGSRGTVMAGLLENGVYEDSVLFYSENLKHKVDRSVFDTPWLYREEFKVQDKPGGNHFFLKTHGIASKADIYLNGELIASSSFQGGAYGGHTYDVTQQLRTGVNALLIQAYQTNYYDDLAISFIDWAPHPPDNGTGVWRNVELSQTGPVSVSPPRIVTDLTDPAAKSVHVTVKVDVANHEAKHVRGTISGAIEAEDESQSARLSRPFKLNPNERKTTEITVELKDPKIWWPAGWGTQPLYTVQLAAILDRGSLSDKAESRSFGIRQVTSHVNAHNDREFQVNGHPFLVLGAGYTSDLFLRFDADRVKKIFQYILDMGMNTVRLEGKPEHPELYDMADRMGLMVMTGWECCDRWESWKVGRRMIRATTAD